MELSGKDIQDFNQAKFCHICESHCKENEKRVRDHCHLTGKTEVQHITNVIFNVANL